MLNAIEIGNVFKRAHTNSRFKFKTVAKKLQPKTPYAILDVNEQSTPAQIKKAYIKKARELHPDSNPHAKDEDFVELQTAYEELLERHKNHTGKPRRSTETGRPYTTSQSARTYNRYKDFTDDPSFKGHSKHYENVRKENTTEFEHSDSKDKNMSVQLLGVVFGSYLTTLIFCLKNYQLEDGSRQSMVGQIIGHFSGDQRYSWRQLFRKKAVKEKMAEYRDDKEKRKIAAVDRSKIDPYARTEKFVDKTAIAFREEKKKHDQYMGRFKDQIYRDLGEDVYNTSVGTYDSSNPTTGQKPGVKIDPMRAEMRSNAAWQTKAYTRYAASGSGIGKHNFGQKDEKS